MASISISKKSTSISKLFQKMRITYSKVEQALTWCNCMHNFSYPTSPKKIAITCNIETLHIGMTCFTLILSLENTI